MNTSNKEKTLSVLSLNCWGLYVISKKRQIRLRAIADEISLQHYDIVALQECWMKQDFEYIKNRVEQNLPYTKYYQSGSLGSGLAILSRYPIQSSSYLKFSLAGRPLKILEGDYYVGKGCGSACIDHPQLGLVDVFTTHLQACYEDSDMYEAQRITECWQIANSVRSSAAQGRHVILAGDFNSIPTSNCYQILSHHGFMTDSWLELHEQSIKDNLERLERREITPKECIQLFGITCDSPVNTWTKHLFKQEAYVREVGDRLDYIYYRRTPQITCQQSNVVMDEHIPNTEINFSDHYGVHSIFAISASSNQASPSEEQSQFAPIASQVARPNVTKLSTSTLCTCIDILQKDQQQAKATSKRLLAFSIFSVIIVLAAFIAQVALPVMYYDSPSSMLLSSALCGSLMVIFTLLAVITLVVGFVFGRMEQRTLGQYLVDFQVYLETLQSTVTRTEESHITQDNNSYSSSFSSSATQEGLITKHT